MLRRLQFALDGPLERSGAVHRVVAHTGEPVEGIGIELECQLLVVEPLGQAPHLQFHDLAQFLLLEAVEDDRFIQAVEEFRAEVGTEGLAQIQPTDQTLGEGGSAMQSTLHEASELQAGVFTSEVEPVANPLLQPGVDPCDFP